MRSPDVQPDATRNVAPVVWALWLLYTVVLGALYSRVPPNPDQQIFDYIGWVGLNGSRFYVDVVEQNFPGEMVLHELSTWLFGNQIWSYRLLDYLLMLLVGCGSLFALCRLAGRRWEGNLVVPLYQAMYVTSPGWFVGQRDVVAAHILLGAGAALIKRERGGGAAWLVAVGLGVTTAVLIRPTFLLFALALLAHDAGSVRARTRSWRAIVIDTLIVAGVIAAAAGAILLFAWKRGALAPWYDACVRFNAEMYSYSVSIAQMSRKWFWGIAKTWHWYVAFSILGAIAWWRRGIGRDVLGILAGLVATSVISAYVQGKGFDYHLGGLLPALAIPIAACLIASIDGWRARPTWATGLIVVAAMAVAVLGLGKKTWGSLSAQIEWYLGRRSMQAMLAEHIAGIDGSTMADVIEASDFLQRTTSSETTLLTAARPVAINFLARRRSPSRFITFGMLASLNERFALSKKWSEEFAQMLATAPPDRILAPAPNAGAEYERFWHDSPVATPVSLLRREISARYSFEQRFGSMDLYRLRER